MMAWRWSRERGDNDPDRLDRGDAWLADPRWQRTCIFPFKRKPGRSVGVDLGGYFFGCVYPGFFFDLEIHVGMRTLI